MLFIGPPFGNYIDLPHSVSIMGSFTLEKRNGLLLQILKTLRYSPTYGGWTNKIGLRNKGIDWAIKNHNPHKIYSVAILHENEIPLLVEKIPKNMNIELNVSCPNAEKSMVKIGLQKFIDPNRKYCIVKVSPTTDTKTIDTFYNQGFRQFHCCNTLPIKTGGLSGTTLIPYTTKLVEYIHNKYPDCEIIAGGGVQNYETFKYYSNLGAKHIAVSTIIFNPFKFCALYYNYIQNNKP
jgi:dihydroorotate dehydrogenase